MVKPRFVPVVCLYLAFAAAAFAQTSYVFQLPGLAQSGQAPQVAAVGDNDFSRKLGPGNNASYGGATKVVATPDGSKFYFATPKGMFEAKVTTSDRTLNSPTPLSAISGAVSDAVITADGKYLFVVGTHLYTVATATDALAVDADTGVPAGNSPVAVAVSHDGKTAWILSTSGTGSTITAMNLAATGGPQVSATQLTLISGATSMVLSPGNLLYVTTGANKLFEIDPVTLTVTPLGEIAISGLAGPIQFTPDGTTAYFVNQTACGTCAAAFKLSVQTHAITTLALPTDNTAPPTIDQILVAGNNRVFGLSSVTNILYDITPAPFAMTPTALGQLPTSTVVAAAVSNENPSSRYLYLLFANHNFDRINLASNGVDQQTILDPVNGLILSFVSLPAQSGGASLSLINSSQNLTPGATAILIGQVLDPVGRPVMGANASFSADPASGIAITNPTLVTTAGGWAQTTVTAPLTPAIYTVTLTSGNLTGNFTLNVNASNSGGNTGGNGTPQMSIYAGDGQLLKQSDLARLPLTVKVVDGSGNPLPGVSVAFQVTEGIGAVSLRNQGLTDQDGLARADYSSANIPQNASIKLSKISATSIYGTLEFFETTHNAGPNDLQPGFNLVTPATRRISIPQGGFLPSAITIQTFTEKQPAMLVPNVGLRLVDNAQNPTANSQIAVCQGLSRGDASGFSHCDLQMLPGACQLGTQDVGIFVIPGESPVTAFALTLSITQGSATALIPLSPLNQTGAPGNAFTLTARVNDGCGKAISTGGLAWGFIQGSAPANFASAQTSSDAGGSVSASVVLGSTAGVVQVQLTGPGVTPIIFKITNQISISGISVVQPLPPAVAVGQQFQPLTFVVRDANNSPVSGTQVNFSVSGGASLNTGSATTNAQGQVQVIVTAGSTAGNIVVTASAGSASTTATLSSHPAAPSITSASFTNAATGAPGMSPCGFVTVTGAGVASGVTGVVAPVSFFGAYPYSVAGLSITVNGNLVPIQAVANDQFGQRANFQAPCELTGSSATVVVTLNGGSATVTGVPVLQVQPGIFTYTGPNNKLYGAVIREVDGTYVTATNPARQGEKVYVVTTGLGQASPTLITNSAGTGTQNVILPTAVFLSGRGIPALSARYLFGWVGAYLVEFQVPADSPIGPDQSLIVIETSADGNSFLGVSNTVLVPAVSDASGGGTSTGTGGGGTGTGGGGTGTGGGGTGTGGGGTGTGGGGTGTGGGGTGTAGGTTPTQDEINSWIARGNYVSGQLSLTRSTTFTTTDNLTGGSPTTSTTKTDSFSGQFTKTSGADLSKALNNQLPAGFPVLSPAVGTCTVYTLSSLTNPFPNLTTVGLEAGAQLTSNGPNGTQLASRQNTQGFGFSYNATGVPNTYLAAGHYTLSGPGGADVGLFNGGLDTVADLVVTNPDNFKSINRSGGITVNWTGGEQSGIVVISGTSSTSTLNINGPAVTITAFVCTQNVSAGQFTVPASVLTQLPASQVTGAGTVSIITRGSFSVTSSGKGARFTAPSGVDILTANNSWVWTFTPQYQ
jgi:uncharacterized protein (TIGR03437 family)